MKNNISQPQAIKLPIKNQSPDVSNMSLKEMEKLKLDIAKTLARKMLSCTSRADNPSAFINYLKNNDPVARSRFTNEMLAEFIELADVYLHLSNSIDSRIEEERTPVIALTLNEILESALKMQVRDQVEYARRRRESNPKLH